MHIKGILACLGGGAALENDFPGIVIQPERKVSRVD